MLWRKAWLETRWRFLIGLAILAILAAGSVYGYATAARLLPNLAAINPEAPASGELERRIREAIELQREFRGFVWWQTIRQNLSQMVTLFAVLLGCGGLLAETSARSALFTLSLPVSRRQLIGTRAGLGLLQCLALAVLPPLLIPLLAPSIGQRYALVDAVAHGICLFAVAAVFYALASLLSTIFADLWRPLLLACGLAVVLAVAEAAVPGFVGPFRVMSGESYFRGGSMPWIGLAVSAVAAAALLRSAAASLERREF